MKDVKEHRVEILTGQYPAASGEEQETVKRIFGEDAAYCFELYFHWYNIIHELGHAIYDLHCPQRHDAMEEEQWVNYFAVAYWRHYGEPEKLQQLADFVKGALGRCTVPEEYAGDLLQYGREAWEKGTLYTFNNYGFFQFGCVVRALSREVTLEQVLRNMGIAGISLQEKRLLSYPVDARMPERVLADAGACLKGWGVALPEDMKVVFVEDPNCQMCKVEKR